MTSQYYDIFCFGAILMACFSFTVFASPVVAAATNLGYPRGDISMSRLHWRRLARSSSVAQSEISHRRFARGGGGLSSIIGAIMPMFQGNNGAEGGGENPVAQSGASSMGDIDKIIPDMDLGLSPDMSSQMSGMATSGKFLIDLVQEPGGVNELVTLLNDKDAIGGLLPGGDGGGGGGKGGSGGKSKGNSGGSGERDEATRKPQGGGGGGATTRRPRVWDNDTPAPKGGGGSNKGAQRSDEQSNNRGGSNGKVTTRRARTWDNDTPPPKVKSNRPTDQETSTADDENTDKDSANKSEAHDDDQES